MKHIIRFRDQNNAIQMGVPKDNGTAQLLAGSIESGFHPLKKKAQINQILAPLDPVNIFAIGFNYADHIDETNFDKPRSPVVFMKATSSVTHHLGHIQIPHCEIKGPETDYEGELAVIIGKRGCNILREAALDHVFGYTCANDVSARRWQKHGGAGQWVRAKSFDTFCPLGPHIVPASRIDDVQNLQIETRLNNETMQNSNTSKMIFSVADIISFLSTDTTLLPGTVILTGTPDGVGFAQKPMRFLQPDDTVDVIIENIGQLSNTVAHTPGPPQ